MQKIESVTVTKLFGYEGNDYTVKFIKNSQITFLYAFNGVGKTTLLKLMYAALNQKFDILNSIDFDTLTISFYDREQIIVKKFFINENITKEEIKKQLIKDKSGNFYFPIIYYIKLKWKTIECKYFYDSVAETISEVKSHLQNVHSDILFANKDYNRLIKTKNNDLNLFKDFFEPSLSSDSIPVELSVAKKIIDKKSEEISKTRNELDSNYEKMKSSIEIGNTPKKGLFSIIGKPTFAQSIGLSVGLFMSALGGPFTLLATATGFYKILRESNKTKEKMLEEFDEKEKYVDFPLPDKISYIEEYLHNESSIKKQETRFQEKLTLFEEIINDYNELTDKKIYINRENYKLEISTIFNDDKNLSAKYLSSGEKNILLLYFHLIFEIDETNSGQNSFIDFIDEPEVSMHPVWLMNFIKSMNHINETLDREKNYQYILATHSSAISYAHSKLMVEMKRNGKK